MQLGLRNMAIGAVVCIIGIVVTGRKSCWRRASGGGDYVVAWGAIVFGGIQFLKGLFQLASERARRVELPHGATLPRARCLAWNSDRLRRRRSCPAISVRRTPASLAYVPGIDVFATGVATGSIHALPSCR